LSYRTFVAKKKTSFYRNPRKPITFAKMVLNIFAYTLDDPRWDLVLHDPATQEYVVRNLGNRGSKEPLIKEQKDENLHYMFTVHDDKTFEDEFSAVMDELHSRGDSNVRSRHFAWNFFWMIINRTCGNAECKAADERLEGLLQDKQTRALC
jgi:hypothetical protein